MRFLVLSLRRSLSDKAFLFFSIALPVFFYIIFGATQSYGDKQLFDGNVNAFVMIGMAWYAGAVGAVGSAGATVVELNSGWNRQLALTPLRQSRLALARFIALLVHAALPVLAVYIAGAIGGATMTPGDWIASGALCVLTSVPFGIYGIGWAKLLRTPSSVSIAASSLVVLAFAGNAFSPLPESFLSFARFTPAYGAAALARYPLGEGMQAIAAEPYSVTDPLSYAVINALAWTLLFVLVVVLLHRRDKARA
ncbi:ABC transporter permease [Corynebacterium gerontici]|uniref:ABC-2 family transporter protein n=1 Tax=Corynebacterium gerontici TaxID=2079234 RepID=A0A3G6IYR7_9CORY|nr:ABC transporter permease [Corynebacterium gerontici]AZA10919.1 ABC-2 family transporter protein [Corynebacterium gerontici]